MVTLKNVFFVHLYQGFLLKYGLKNCYTM